MHVCGVIVLRFFGRMIDGLLDRVFCIAGAIGLSQIPGIIQQYVDVLSGALAEARRNVETFREQAALVGWKIGNLHFPVQIVEGFLRVTVDPMVETLLKRENWPYEEISVTFQPLRLPPEAVVPPPVEGS